MIKPIKKEIVIYKGHSKLPFGKSPFLKEKYQPVLNKIIDESIPEKYRYDRDFKINGLPPGFKGCLKLLINKNNLITIVLCDGDKRIKKFMYSLLLTLSSGRRNILLFDFENYLIIPRTYLIQLFICLPFRYVKELMFKFLVIFMLMLFFASTYSVKKDPKKKLKIALLPKDFPPHMGGISTWFVNLANCIMRDNNATVFAKKEKHTLFDEKYKFKIKRISEKKDIGIVYFFILLIQIAYMKIVLFKKNDAFTNKDSLKKLIAVIKKSGYRELIYAIMYLRSLLKESVDEPFDISLCGWAHPPGIAAWMLHHATGTPFIIFCHGKEVLTWIDSSVLKKVFYNILIACGHVIVNSHFTRSLLISFGIPKEKISIVYPGVDPEKFSGEQIKILNIPVKDRENKIILLTVANIVERKGHDTVIKAMHIMKHHNKIEYLIAGTGDHAGHLKKLVHSLGLERRVHFLGRIEDSYLPSLYYFSDIFIMPSRQIENDVEGFGISFIEAAICGKPSIGTLSGGIPDAIVHNETGLLIEPDNPEKLSEALEKLSINSGLRNKMGFKAQKRAANQFTWQNNYNLTMQIIKKHTRAHCV